MPDLKDSGIGDAGLRLKLFNNTNSLSDSAKLNYKKRKKINILT